MVIKHLVIRNNNYTVYLCNQAVIADDEEKIANDYNDVTCRNCLRALKKLSVPPSE